MITSKQIKRLSVMVLIVLLVVGFLLYRRPLPQLQPTTTIKSPVPDAAIKLPWPNYGQSAFGAVSFGLLETNRQQTAAPMASVAKVMTALAVLKQKPLSVDEQGPAITITPSDVDIYNSYYSQGGSVVKVVAGEKISEYQALQAMLLPSANNFADTLATWAFGSTDKYTLYANQLAQTLSLNQTHIADASGFSSQTMSSAQDLVMLGETAIANPVIAKIVNLGQATIPEAGEVKNVNWLLGSDGVSGIKTGDTEQAGGCYLFAARRVVDKQIVTIVGAIMGAPTLNDAIRDAQPIIQASDAGFSTETLVKAGQVVGNYQLPWGGKVDGVAQKDSTLLTWKGSKIHTSASLSTLKPSVTKGATVGSVNVTSGQQTGSTNVIISQKVPGPSLHWRLFR